MQRTKIGNPKEGVDYDYYSELLDDDEVNVVMGDETEELLEAMVKEQEAEMAYMKRLYDKGALNPTAGETTRGRLKMLEDKAQSGEAISADETAEIKRLSEIFNKAQGGRIGFSKGKLADVARRKFMKAAGATGAGIAALKTGLLGFGEKAAPVVETAVEAAKGVPPYFFQLVDVIKSKGREIKSYGDRVKQYIAPSKDGKSELMLTEDLSTGDVQVKKIYKENDEMVTKSEEMNFTKGRGDESTKGTPADDYEEVTEFNSRIYKDEFNDPDVVEGIDVDEIVKEIDVKKAPGIVTGKL